MRICFFGTYTLAAGYPVNRYLIQALGEAGGEVEECHAELWTGFLHATLETGRWRTLMRLVARGIGGYLHLLWRYARCGAHEWILVGYPGYADVLLARLLRLGRRRQVALVAFISLYDTLVLDRERVPAGSLRARVLHGIDRLAFRSADLVLVDTHAQGRFYARLFDMDVRRFQRSFVGHEFAQGGAVPPTSGGVRRELRVLFFGTYVPLHGVEVILRAAACLRHRTEIGFTLIGRGQLFADMRQLMADLELERVQLLAEWQSAPALREQVLAADVCLGVFGTTDKASRVIPYKVLGALALSRPVITRDGPGIRELLVNDESALLCPAGDAEALAECVLRLRREPGLAARLAAAGHAAYLRRVAPAAVGRCLLSTLTEASGGV